MLNIKFYNRIEQIFIKFSRQIKRDVIKGDSKKSTRYQKTPPRIINKILAISTYIFFSVYEWDRCAKSIPA